MVTYVVEVFHGCGHPETVQMQFPVPDTTDELMLPICHIRQAKKEHQRRFCAFCLLAHRTVSFRMRNTEPGRRRFFHVRKVHSGYLAEQPPHRA